VQVVPIKPKLKAPRSKRLNLRYDSLLPSFAFKLGLRHYTMVEFKLGMSGALLLLPYIPARPFAWLAGQGDATPVVGHAGCCSPYHRLPFNSPDEGSKWVA